MRHVIKVFKGIAATDFHEQDFICKTPCRSAITQNQLGMIFEALEIYLMKGQKQGDASVLSDF